jgi:SAM-dependent methyltransferase
MGDLSDGTVEQSGDVLERVFDACLDRFSGRVRRTLGQRRKLLGLDSIDGVHCGAVFEHLRDPQDAAAELFRVMKPGAIGFIGTPFIVPFHGYPSHYQNFTHAGHQRLFERAGFRVLEWGVSSGPAWMMAGIVLAFISTYFPAPLKWPALALWFPIGLFLIRPLDRWLVNNDKAYMLATDTYVLIAK